MIRILYFPPDGDVVTDKTLADLPALLAEPTAVTWIDFDREDPATVEPLLSDTFKFHPLAVEDALQDINLAKLDDWESYLYIVLHSVVPGAPGTTDFSFFELDLFLGANYLVTYHEEASTAVDHVWQLVQRDRRYPARRPDRLLYRIADEFATDYVSLLGQLEDSLDQVEQQVFDEPNPETMSYIFNQKRSLQEMRRHVAPQRELFNKLARDPFAVVSPGDRVFFRDLYDKMVRVYEMIEGQRDLVGGAMDLYLSAVNNRMNDIMKTLTVITTMFLPLSFITGFFGMNFFQPVFATSIWTGVAAFTLVLAALIAIPLGMYSFMKRRNWV